MTSPGPKSTMVWRALLTVASLAVVVVLARRTFSGVSDQTEHLVKAWALAGIGTFLFAWSLVLGRAHGEAHAFGVWLGWVVPGLGHAVVGQWRKGLVFFAILMTALATGLWLTSWHTVAFEDQPFYFIGQYGSGLTWLTHVLLGVKKAHPNEALPVTWFDPGMLYTATAGLMNLVIVLNLYRAPKAAAPPEPASKRKDKDIEKETITDLQPKECAEAGSALITAIISIFIFGPIIGPVAIARGFKARRMIAENPGTTGLIKANLAVAVGLNAMSFWILSFLCFAGKISVIMVGIMTLVLLIPSVLWAVTVGAPQGPAPEAKP